MGNWFDRSIRGGVFGLWHCSSAIGNIVGALSASLIINHLSWPFALVISAIQMGICTAFFGSFIEEKPDDKKLSEDEIIESPINTSFISVCLVPGVVIYAWIYTCVKLVNYGLMMWLPYYIHQELVIGSQYTGIIAALYDVGSIIGCMLFGAISDHWSYRSFVLCPMLLISIPLLLLLRVLKYYVYLFFLVPALGVFIAASSGIIATAVSADLA